MSKNVLFVLVSVDDYIINKLRDFFPTDLSGRGSGSLRPFFTKEGSEASTTPIASEAATTTGGSPPTPPVDFEASTTGAIISTDPLKINNNNSLNIGGLLPSTAASSVVRALSPLLTPAAFKAAANNMSQKVVLKAKEAVQGIEPQQQSHHVHGTIVEEQVVHKITPEELPMMSQVKLDYCMMPTFLKLLCSQPEEVENFYDMCANNNHEIVILF